MQHDLVSFDSFISFGRHGFPIISISHQVCILKSHPNVFDTGAWLGFFIFKARLACRFNFFRYFIADFAPLARKHALEGTTKDLVELVETNLFACRYMEPVLWVFQRYPRFQRHYLWLVFCVRERPAAKSWKRSADFGDLDGPAVQAWSATDYNDEVRSMDSSIHEVLLAPLAI